MHTPFSSFLMDEGIQSKPFPTLQELELKLKRLDNLSPSVPKSQGCWGCFSSSSKLDNGILHSIWLVFYSFGVESSLPLKDVCIFQPSGPLVKYH